MNGLGIPISPHQPSPIQQLPPLSAKRKTLERNIRNTQLSGGTTESTKTMIEGEFNVIFNASFILCKHLFLNR